MVSTAASSASKVLSPSAASTMPIERTPPGRYPPTQVTTRPCCTSASKKPSNTTVATATASANASAANRGSRLPSASSTHAPSSGSATASPVKASASQLVQLVRHDRAVALGDLHAHGEQQCGDRRGD